MQLEILRRFEYDPEMMMSGVIAKSKSSAHGERAQVLIKGASYEVSQLADPESLPKDWAQVQQPQHHSSSLHWPMLKHLFKGVPCSQPVQLLGVHGVCLKTTPRGADP